MSSTSILPSPISRSLISLFEEQCDKSRAPGMAAYMKHQFSFFGVSAPVRKLITKEVRASMSLSLEDPFPVWVKECWDSPFREMQYAALDILSSKKKKLSPIHVPMLEWMMVNKSWWDTVDGIAPSLVGSVFLSYPDSRDDYIFKWLRCENMWLQRASILFQLKHGRQTDWDFLQLAIKTHIDSKEFFIRKAQGWALRQYAKVAPAVVRSFVSNHPELSGLTKREALKHL